MKQQNINSDEEIKRDQENHHYSFHRMNKGIGKYVWTWILILCFLTPQFSYNAEAGLWGSICDAWDTVYGGTTDVAKDAWDGGKDLVDHTLNQLKRTEDQIMDVAQGALNTIENGIEGIGKTGKRVAKEVERGGHKVEKYMIRPLKEPEVIGKVFTVGVAASLTGGILVPALLAGTTSVAYDRVVFNVHNGGVLTKSFLTAAGSTAVSAAFDKYMPVRDPETGKVLLTTGEQYARGVAISASHIAVGQATSLIVDGKGTLGGRAWSGALAGAFVPSVQLVTDNNLVATLVDPINRSVVEQSVVNRFNMKKVDFGLAVASGAQALRDQYVRETGTEFGKFVKNWYESEQESSPAKSEIASKKGNKNKKSVSDYVEEKAMSDNITGVVVDLENFSQESFREAIMEAYCKGVPVVIIDESGNRYVCKMARRLNIPGGGWLYNGSDSLWRHDLLVERATGHPIENGKVLYSPNDSIVGDRGFHTPSKLGIVGSGEVMLNEPPNENYNYEVSRRENGEPICYNIEYYNAVKDDITAKWNSKMYLLGPGNAFNCKGYAKDMDEAMARVKTCSEWQVSKFLNPQNRSQK